MNTQRQHEREQWEEMPEIYIRLHKDELGYPPKEWEQLKGERTKKGDVFRIKNIPFYARGIAWEDEVSVTKSEEGYYPVFESVIERSGYSTIRLMIENDEDRDKLIDFFTEHETFLEFNGRLVALAIPRHRYEEVMEYVCKEKDRGRWDAEEGFLIVDDPRDEPKKGPAI
ncbi:MAG TPA: DUF4265 domain-containing protein [Candidatus Angelobacter sp.]|jgi:hypothetical protein|nr:DUF4265 domain-containing protein [Candidatus Angelobacter sp.]